VLYWWSSVGAPMRNPSGKKKRGRPTMKRVQIVADTPLYSKSTGLRLELAGGAMAGWPRSRAPTALDAPQLRNSGYLRPIDATKGTREMRHEQPTQAGITSLPGSSAHGARDRCLMIVHTKPQHRRSANASHADNFTRVLHPHRYAHRQRHSRPPTTVVQSA
jgi:hypothetical protein